MPPSFNNKLQWAFLSAVT